MVCTSSHETQKPSISKTFVESPVVLSLIFPSISSLLNMTSPSQQLTLTHTRASAFILDPKILPQEFTEAYPRYFTSASGKAFATKVSSKPFEIQLFFSILHYYQNHWFTIPAHRCHYWLGYSLTNFPSQNRKTLFFGISNANIYSKFDLKTRF